MNTMQKLTEWIRKHSVWLAVGLLIISTYSIGWVSAAIFIRNDYAESLKRIDRAYTQSIIDKDKVIKKLAESSAKVMKEATKQQEQNEEH